MLVLSSPSGAGKTTISRAMLERDAGLTMSISATTRPMRPGEVDGKDYYFKVFSFNGSKKKIKSGFEVDFFVQESFDKSKNKKSFQAVNITVSNHR